MLIDGKLVLGSSRTADPSGRALSDLLLARLVLTFPQRS